MGPDGGEQIQQGLPQIRAVLQQEGPYLRGRQSSVLGKLGIHSRSLGRCLSFGLFHCLPFCRGRSLFRTLRRSFGLCGSAFRSRKRGGFGSLCSLFLRVGRCDGSRGRSLRRRICRVRGVGLVRACVGSVLLCGFFCGRALCRGLSFGLFHGLAFCRGRSLFRTLRRGFGLCRRILRRRGGFRSGA